MKPLAIVGVACGLFQSADAPKPFTVSFAFDRQAYLRAYRIKTVEAVEVVNGDDKVRLSKMIRGEAGAYPPDLLTRVLDSVCFVERLSFDEVPYVGTYLARQKQVVLALGNSQGRFTDDWVKETFHHELSSLVLRAFRDSFDREEWFRQADPSAKYAYRDSGFQAIKNKKATLWFETSLHGQGFLSQYGTSDFENDFNTFAAAIMGPRAPDFWKRAELFPRLHAKAIVLLRFYRKANPNFRLPSTVPQEAKERLRKAK